MQIQWINERRALEDCLGDLDRHGCIGIDTEFVRTRTFYPEIALYQLASDEQVYLVDPLKIEDMSSLGRWLQVPRRVHVMHSCSEDLEVFLRHLNLAMPARLFDTQMAFACIAPQSSLSYQSLVREVLSVEIDKAETRSDWLRRPLSPAQLRYAAEDVHFLPELYRRLYARACDLGREAWVWEESASYQAHLRDPHEYYRSVRDAWRLDREQLAWLKLVVGWREQKARTRDLPRSRVVPDAVLFDVARLRGAVGSLKRPLAEVAEVFRAELLALVQGASFVEAELPPAVPGPLQKSDAALVNMLKSRVVELAAELGVAEGTLAARRHLEALVRAQLSHGDLPPAFRGWRGSVVYPHLEPLLRGGA